MENENLAKLKSPLSEKLIYVFTINDETHRGTVKIGETTFNVPFEDESRGFSNLIDNCKELNNAARKRIDQYTQTAGIPYQLLYTTLAIRLDNNGNQVVFNDHDVHKVLERSGFSCVNFGSKKTKSEWFKISLDIAKNAINAVKEGRNSLNPSEIVVDDFEHKQPRDEQRDAINKAKKHFESKNGKKFLWNCKMRFGKTFSALTLVKEMGLKKTIIITHRPSVDASWYDDFNDVFHGSDYVYASKNRGEKFPVKDKPFVYFASIQDLRGSEEVGGNFNKNDDVFSIDYDLVVVDEAHEGTQTELGKSVVDALIKENTKLLALSGTPFNLLDSGEYADDEIYTWDYIQEQKAKLDWEKNRPFEPNPYASLPRLNIRTYNIGEMFKGFVADEFFNFTEFFKVDDNGKFVYEYDVERFLDMLTENSDTSGYPFSNETYRKLFAHTFWVLPGVKEAKALENLLKKHSVFGEGSGYKIINVAGDGSDDITTSKAYEQVIEAIDENPYTITLSCGRLTTGVTVKKWTAVFMLYGNYFTSCASYMQTIFRVQSPAVIDGKVKTECYVFDFAPDRTLKVVSEAVKRSRSHVKNGEITTDDTKTALVDFLNFCPIISENCGTFKPYNVQSLLETLKKVYIENVVKNGFDDVKIYSNDYLSHLDKDQVEALNRVHKIVGHTKAQCKIKEIEVANAGLTTPEKDELNALNEKANGEKGLSEAEKKKQKDLMAKEAKEALKQKKNAINILRGVSIRIPLLMYGAKLKDTETEDEALSVENFTSLVDDASWKEFMPDGFTKEMFDNDIKRAYDPDVFLAASKKIRTMAKSLDNESVVNRIKQLSYIFSTFRNPDKETVLTPWRVVNMHLGDTLGGWNFFDENYKTELEDPRYINIEDVTDRVFTSDAKVLEINSKTGLYPLYMAYSIFRERAKTELKDSTMESEKALWKKVVAENIFALCKSNMAKEITYRTLLGFDRGDDKANLKYEENLISKVKEGSQIKPLIEKLHNTQTWSAYRKIAKEDRVNFTCVVGNPPYQEMVDNKMSRNVYHDFINLGIDTQSNFITLVSPSKWMGGELGPYKEMNGFFKKFTNENHLKFVYDYCKSTDLFSNVDIKGGIGYFLYQNDYKGSFDFVVQDKGKRTKSNVLIQEGDTTIIRFPLLYDIVEKVKKLSKGSTMTSIVSSWNPYGFISDFFEKNNENVRQSETKLKDDDVLIHGLIKNKRYIRYIPNEDAKKNRKGMMMYKVFVPRANGSGALGEKFSTPILGTPIQICTDTFLEVGPFETEGEAKACLQYIKTKFFRAMVGAKKTGVFNYKDAFRYVPLQDFTDKSDIDWSVSVSEIDKQLYKKYGLSDDDIAFIETNVKPME